MRSTKELSQWLEACGLNQTPWASDPADWATLLNLLTRLLHSTLELREESESTSRPEEEEDHQKLLRSPSMVYPGTQLPFQEVSDFVMFEKGNIGELAEKVLGVPQFTVIADMKKSLSEDQRALFVSFCALRYAVEHVDTKPIHDFQFTFRIYFNMDLDGSKRECNTCGNIVHLIERVTLIGRIWHRACLKCSLCGRQLYRGAFYLLHFSDASIRLECVEHGANAILFGDPKHRLALPPPLPPPLPITSSRLSFIGSENMLNKRASSLLSLSSPPPRPPPPRLQSIDAVKKHTKSNISEEKDLKDTSTSKEEEESIESKIALAAAACHDAPIPKPRVSLQQACNKQLQHKNGEKTWEESKESQKENYDKNGKETEKRPVSVVNPFDDTDEEEDLKENEEMKESISCSPLPKIEEVKEQEENLQSPNNPFDKSEDNTEGEEEKCPPKVKQRQQQQNIHSPPPPPLPPSFTPQNRPTSEIISSTSCAFQSNNNQNIPQKSPNNLFEKPKCFQYIPPLGPMPYRTCVEVKHFSDKIEDEKSSSSDHSLLHELDTKLRRLHAQLDHLEITGERLEGQIIRELNKEDCQIWRKSGKRLASEYAKIVEQRCAALAMEAILVRRYMDVYLRLTHSQLDIQLENVLLTEPKKQQQLNELLAQLLHIRNELTQLESREREAKNAAASAATRDSNKEETSPPKKALKTKNKGEKSPRKESTNEETIQQQLPTTSGGPVEKEKSKGGGGSRLLKNTLKSLKKNL
uniref:LIM zinc-binding domain-containing protein n=2 Tax=Meloidogyne incognita group TaxID=654580 RepID=A0A915LQC5_MELJA